MPQTVVKKKGVLAGLLAVAVVMGSFLSAPHAGATPSSIYTLMVDGAWQTLDVGSSAAQSFTTGSTAVNLDSVSVWVRNANQSGNSSVSSSYSLAVYSDYAGIPGTLVATITSGHDLARWADGQVLHQTNVPLSASTRYWMVMTGVSGGTAAWKYSSTAPATNVSPTPSFANRYRQVVGWVGGPASGGFNMSLVTTSNAPTTTTPPTTTPAPSASCPARRPYRIYNNAMSRGIGAHLVARCGYRTEWRRVYRTMGAFAVPNEWARKKVVPQRWWF